MKNGPYELTRAPEGYPGKLYRGRYSYEHHLVWWQHTGQLVPDGFVLHHKNENKRDNRFENLELQTVGAHTAHHNKLALLEVACGWCGKVVALKPSRMRQRQRKNKNGKVFCSRSCGAKNQFN